MTSILMLVITGLICLSERNSRHYHTLEFWFAYLTYFVVSYLTQSYGPAIVALSTFVWIWRTKSIVCILSDVVSSQLWKPWHTLILIGGYTLGVLLYFAGLEFTFFTMPPALANFMVGIEVLYQAVKIKRTRKCFSIPHKLLLLTCLIIFLHVLDYPFLRYDHELTGVGFAAVLMTTILMAILLPTISYYDLERNHKEEVEKILRQRIEQLKHQSRFSALGEVTAGIVHEIDHPLSIITERSGHLRHQVLRDRASKDSLMSDLNQIEATSEKMNKIINSLRKFTERSKSEPIEIVAIATVIEDTLSYCSDRFSKANILLDIEPYPAKDIECRSIQISQVLLNLLNNSFDAIQHSNHPWIRILFEEESTFIRIKVIDSGVGILEVLRPKLFDPFFSTKLDGGTGLGLSISKSIIEAHKGRLYYDENHQNTCFAIELPYRQNTSA